MNMNILNAFVPSTVSPTVTVVEVFMRLVDLLFGEVAVFVQSAFPSTAGHMLPTFTSASDSIQYQLFSDQKASVVLTQNSLERISQSQALLQMYCPQFI